MDNYTNNSSKKPNTENNGCFNGYSLNKEKTGMEIDYIDTMLGHQYSPNETATSHVYHVIEGNGVANIDGNIYNIESGDTIEIPVDTKFAFEGDLKMVEVMNSPF